MKKTLIAAVIIAALMLIPAAILSWQIITYGRSAPFRHADAAIVLGAAVWTDHPSPVFKERIHHAVWLYRHHYIKKIIFTGDRDSRNELPESEVAKKYAEIMKVPEKDILIETLSKTTMENLLYASRLGGKYGLKSYLIVSDPLHMKRAMLISRDLHIEAYESPTPTSRYRSRGQKILFLGREVYFSLWYYLERLFITLE